MRGSSIVKAMSAAAALLVFAAVPALADAPKFFSATSSVNKSGALVVNFEERGLGNENVNYELTADGDVTWACINGGGKNPSAENKRTESFPVLTKKSFEPKNGKVIATITSDAPTPPDFCPKGQRLVRESVSYTNIVLTDTTNDVSTNVPDASS